MFDKVDMQKPKHLLAIIGTFFIFAALPLTVYLVITSQERAREGPQAVVPLQGNFVESTFITDLNIPTSMAFAPDGRLFVAEKGDNVNNIPGKVRVIKDGKLLSAPFLTVSVNSSRERGLIGIAFDPDFESNRFVYIHYTRQVNTDTVRGRISRFTASRTNPDVAQSGSEFILLDNIPSPVGGRHQGGAIHFGNDGKLYIGSGDGGFGAANYENAQSLTSLKGKILRINKDGTIPADNPFVGQAGKRGEIWAYGFRNPFSFAVDPEDGRIYANDVGQDTWEEVNNIEKGRTYGWAPCEGPFEIGVEMVPGACSNVFFAYPIHSYQHVQPFAITGAAFYRGNQFPKEYLGSYFFGDYVGNFIKRLDESNVVSDFQNGTVSPVDIQIGPDGALYYLSFSFIDFEGKVYKIQFAPPTAVASADKILGEPPLTVSFDGKGSSDPNGLPLTFSWDFGDGTFGAGRNVKHTYSFGVFPVNLTVTNSGGASDTADPITITIMKCADIDGDMVVNIRDIVLIINVFGTTTQSSNWNPDADLNDDGRVNMVDITAAVTQFGHPCPFTS